MAKLLSKKYIADESIVYDLEMDHHNYIAEGILVHNCGNDKNIMGKNLQKLNIIPYIVLKFLPYFQC